MPLGGVQVGEVFAKAGAKLDETGFHAYEQRLARARADAARGAKAHLGADVDTRHFAAYEAELAKARARATRQSHYRARLGADFDPSAFSAAERHLSQYERNAQRAGRATGGFSGALKGLIPNLSLMSRFPVYKWAAIAAGIASLIAPTLALGGALGNTAGLLGALPGLAATATGALVAGSLGMRGIGAAVKATWQEQTDAAIATTSATQDVARAQEDAARKVRDLRAEIDALNVSQAGANLQLREARQALGEAQAAGATGLELAQARQKVRDAEQAVTDTRRQSRNATQDLTRAEQDAKTAGNDLAGSQATAAKKMHDLSPAGRTFVKFVSTELFPVLRRLQGIAQAGLLPGVEKGTREAMRNLPVVERIIRGYSSALGDAAAQQGRFFGRRDTGQNLEQVFGSGERLLRRSAKASLDWEQGLIHVALAGRTLLDWLGDMDTRLARVFSTWAQGEQRSGRLEAFFKRAAHNTELLISSIWDFGRALINIGSIGRRVWGQDMLEGIDKAAARFRRWTESVRGEREISGWFKRWRDRWHDVVGEIDKILDRYKQLRRQGKGVAEASAQALTEAFGRALPGIAEGAARIAPHVALAFITGFLSTDAWGKLAIGGWLLAKFGGIGAARSIGADVAGAFASGFGGSKAGGLFGKLSGLLAGRGATPASPLYVFDVNPKKGGGGIPEVVKTGGKVGGALTMLRVVAAGGGALGVVLAPLLVADQLEKGGLQPAHRNPVTGAPLPTGKTPGIAMPDPRKTQRETRGLINSLKDVGQAAVDTNERLKMREIERAANRVSKLRDELSHLGRGTDDYRTKADALKDAQRRLNRLVEDANPAAKHAGRGIRGLGGNVSTLGTVFSDVGTFILGQTNDLLSQFGAKKLGITLRKAPRLQSPESLFGIKHNQAGGLHQFGGRDQAGPDSMFGQIAGFNVAVAPGEVAAVMTRHHRRAMDAVFSPIGGLEGFMAAFARPHSAPPVALQTGGLTGPHGTGEGFIPLTNFLHRRFGLTMTAGRTDHALRTVNGNISRHSVGAAGDYSNGTSPTPQMDAAARVLTRVLGHSVFRPGSNSGPPALHQLLYRTLIGGNHFNHVHTDLEDAYAFSADKTAAILGGGDTKIGRVKIGGGTTTTRAILQAAADKLVKGANRKLRRTLAEEMAPGAVGRGFNDITVKGSGNAANRSLGRKMAAAMGWTGDQWAALDDLWGNLEGHWDENLFNYAGSGAYGIAQALPASKYPVAGQPAAPPGIDKARAQIGWGLNYILTRPGYGSPLAAHAFRLANGWYQRGGLVGMAKGGLLKAAAYVGDSLGEGTLAAGLRGRAAPIRLWADALKSRRSSAGVGVLRSLLRGHKGTDAAVFDLGTNDSNAASLRGSISAVEKMLGSRPLIMPTVGPAVSDAAAKNQLIRRRADQVVDWGAVASSYGGIHPNLAGYRHRAQMVATALGRTRRAGKRSSGGAGTLSASWLNDLLTSGSSPSDIGGQIADRLALFDIGTGHATWKAAPHQGGVTHFATGGLVGPGGQLTGKGTRRAGHLGAGVAKIRDRIEGLGHKYELDSRRFDLSEEEFIIPGDGDTPPSLNKDAIARRTLELTSLVKTRRSMAAQYKKLVDYLTQLNKLWRNIQSRLQMTIGNARGRLKHLGKGKEAQRTRDTLVGRIKKWTERLQGVNSSLATGVQDRQDAGFDWQSTVLDVAELRKELAPLLGGGKGIELPEWQPATTDTSAGAGTDQATQLKLDASERLNKTLSGFLSSFGGPGDIGQAGFITGQAAAAHPTGTPPAGTPGAFFGPGGPGGGVYIHQEINTLHPGDPEVHRAVAGAAVQGIQGQAFRQTNREKSVI